MVCFVDGDAFVHDLKGIKHKGDAIEEVFPPSFLLHELVELFFVLFGDDVPGFGRTLMTVVEGVDP